MPFIIGLLMGMFVIYKLGQHGIWRTVSALFKGCLALVIAGIIILVVLALIAKSLL